MLIATFSGVRFVIDENTQKIVRRYTTAFTRNLQNVLQLQVEQNLVDPKVVNKNLVIVGRDGRNSGDELVSQVVQTLLDAGLEIEYVGVVPTPTVQQIVKAHNAAGGVILTASHNPGNWCGLKFVSASSIFLTPKECEIVYSDLKEEEPFARVEYRKIQNQRLRFIENRAALKEHLDIILGTNIVDVNAIKQRKIIVAFNGMNASGAAYLDLIQETFGIELIRYNDTIGPLPDHPEPTPANLADFKQFLAGKHFDIGFAVDPDADRCVVIDETGEPILEELTLAMCLKYVLSTHKLKHFVKNCSSSMVNDVIAKPYNCEVVETAVGEVNVCMKMRQLNAQLGGEGNGGVIFKDAHLGRDSLVAVCILLGFFASQSRKMSEIVDQLPKFCIKKTKYDFTADQKPKMLSKIDALAEASKKAAEKSRVLTVDGVKLIYDDTEKWVHVRFSNTEPIMRIIAEAHTEQECDQLIKMVEKHVYE